MILTLRELGPRLEKIVLMPFRAFDDSDPPKEAEISLEGLRVLMPFRAFDDSDHQPHLEHVRPDPVLMPFRAFDDSDLILF